MIARDFGRGVMPALTSADGVTTLAFGRSSEDRDNKVLGVEVWRWPAGQIDARAKIATFAGPFRGDPALSPDGTLVAFFNASDEGVVYRLTDPPTLVLNVGRVEGNHAIKLRNTSIVWQPWGKTGVFEFPFAGPGAVRLGDYLPTGLAYLTDTGYVSWDANRLSHPPLTCPAYAGSLVIGQEKDSGLLLALPNSLITWWGRGGAWNDVAACVEGPDLYAFAAWQPLTTLRVVSLTTVDILFALPAYDPAPAPTPEPIQTGIPAFESPFWMAPFYSHSEGYGDTPLADHVGNAICLVEKQGDPTVLPRDLARVLPLGKPLIVEGQRNLGTAHLNQTVAWWAAGSTMAQLESTIQTALSLPERPVIAYLDARGWISSRPSWMADRVWPSVQAYRNPGESLANFDAAIRAQLRAVTTYGTLGIALTPAFYTRNKTIPLADILACMPLYEAWIREFPIRCVMPFADRRPTGMLDNPELRVWGRAFQNAIPAGRPNRYDYWRPKGSSVLDVVTNKLGQSRTAVVLEPWLRTEILAALKRT